MRAIRFALIAGLTVVAACAKKQTAETLPPAPPATAENPAMASNDTVGSQGVAGSAQPGSREDFIQQAGSDRVRFGYDSYELDGEARGVLDRQAEWLGRYGQVRVTIEGHADERGTREYNLALGERRAIAIRDYLAGRGVSASRVQTVSYGKERPEVEGSDEASFAQNRRGVTVLGSGAAA